MCKSKMVLDTIKKAKGRGGLSPLQLQLEDALTEDIQSMKEEIKGVKADIAELRTDVANMSGKLDLLIKQSENKPLLTVIMELIKTKGFWIVLALAVVGIYGLDLAGLKGILQ